MDYIDTEIERQIINLQELQKTKSTILETISDNNKFSIENNINKIKKEVDEYILYHSLKKECFNGHANPMAYDNPLKWKQINEQFKAIDIRRNNRNHSSNTTCKDEYQLLLSQTILELYNKIN